MAGHEDIMSSSSYTSTSPSCSSPTSIHHSNRSWIHSDTDSHSHSYSHNYSYSYTYTIRLASRHDVPRLAHIERSAGQLFRTVGLDSVADDDPMPAEVLLSYLELGNLWVADAETGVVTEADEILTPQVEGDESPGNENKDENQNQNQNQKEKAKEKEKEKEKENKTVVGFLAAFPIVNKRKRRDENHGTEYDNDDENNDTVRSSGTTIFLHIAELSVDADHQRRGLARRLLSTLEKAAEERKTKRGSVVGLSLTTYRDLPFNGPLYAKLGFREIDVADIEPLVGLRARQLWEEEQEKMIAKDAWPERRCWMLKMV